MKLLNETLVPGVGDLPELLTRGAPEAPQTIKAIADAAAAAACVPERGKTPLLKTPHARALTAGHGK